MPARDADFPPNRWLECFLEMLRGASRDDREALVRVALVARPEEPIWRPDFIRIDVARRDDPPPVERDDFGTVKVLVERMSVADLAGRFEALYQPGAPDEICFDNQNISRPFASSWNHGWFDAARARGWGAAWPTDYAGCRIPSRPPLVGEQLEGQIYGTVVGLHGLLRRVSGVEFKGHGDARLGQAFVLVWDYRARFRRVFIEGASLHVHVEPSKSADVSLRGAWRPGDHPLESIRGPGVETLQTLDGAEGAVLTLWGAEKLDEVRVDRSAQRRLIDGTPLPSGEAAAVLQALHPSRINPERPLAERALLARLREHRKGPAALVELRWTLRGLVLDGLIDETGAPRPWIVHPQLPGIPKLPDVYYPDDPKPGEKGYIATPLGGKAAVLLVSEKDVGASWNLGAERLLDQVLVAIGRSGATRASIDAACALATSAEVEGAVEQGRGRGLIQLNELRRATLTENGQGRFLQLNAELQARRAAGLHAAAVPVPAPAPTTAPPATGPIGFVAEPKLLAIIRRDLDELSTASMAGLNKTTLLLAGSIAEAALFDVLNRNPGLASSGAKKKWPDDFGLSRLLDVAGGIRLKLPNSGERSLLSPTTLGFAGTLVEHRDLIHPYAEVRDGIHVDATTAEAMVMLLKLVLRDLQKAHDEGLVAAYVAGATA